MSAVAGALAALPWFVLPTLARRHVRYSRNLDAEPADPPADAPTLAVIIPARNEARNIERCARSVLASTYPALEVIVVDDRSDDGTGDIARALAAADPRLRVIESRPLPPGWFGKQWACAQGAESSHAELLCFTDADTVHAPDLLARAVRAMRSAGAGMLSVVGAQELGTFWERVIQPQVFSLLATRYRSTEWVNNSASATDKIANGQFILIRRDLYTAEGGHAAVRDKVAEDLALAQRFFAAGHRPVIVLGLPQLATRMYTSLGELTAGWMKNIYAGGRNAIPGGRGGRAALPMLLLLPVLIMLAPPLALLAAAAGRASGGVAVWSALASAATLWWWLMVYRRVFKLSLVLSLAYALAFPLGAALLGYIIVRAVARGSRVRWKGREYVSG